MAELIASNDGNISKFKWKLNACAWLKQATN